MINHQKQFDTVLQDYFATKIFSLNVPWLHPNLPKFENVFFLHGNMTTYSRCLHNTASKYENVAEIP